MPTKEQIGQGILDLYKHEREEYRRSAAETAVRIAKEKGFVSADDIHEHCPPPASLDGRIIGTILSHISELKPLHYAKSKRKVCHYRPIVIFGLKDAALTQAIKELK
jgi:hypothetical protein